MQLVVFSFPALPLAMIQRFPEHLLSKDRQRADLSYEELGLSLFVAGIAWPRDHDAVRAAFAHIWCFGRCTGFGLVGVKSFKMKLFMERVARHFSIVFIPIWTLTLCTNVTTSANHSSSSSISI